jgi:hypothetical protein
MKKNYRVLLPVEIDGRIYQFGETVELDVATAVEYSNALATCEAAAPSAPPAPAEPAKEK